MAASLMERVAGDKFNGGAIYLHILHRRRVINQIKEWRASSLEWTNFAKILLDRTPTPNTTITPALTPPPVFYIRGFLCGGGPWRGPHAVRPVGGVFSVRPVGGAQYRNHVCVCVGGGTV